MRHMLLVGFLIAAAAAGASAEAASLTLAWDPNPEPEVVGYRVYVGLRQGTYTETYDVGIRTVFVFSRAVEGQTYHFAVAAYSTWGTGPLSQAISATATGVPPAYPAPPTAPPAAEADRPTARAACVEASPGDCYRTHVLAGSFDPIASPAALPDGRLLFVENGRQVRVVEGSTIAPTPALTAGHGIRLSGLAVDPAFERTRFVFVGEMGARPDGTRTLAIIRYRELGGVLGEGAAVVSGLALPPSGEAPFTLDDRGRLYVAIPAAAPGEHAAPGAYDARILRFAADGSVRRENRAGSPVLALGYARPSALAWNPAGELWAAGVSPDWPPLVGLDVDDQSSAAWPLVPHAVRLSGPASVQPIERMALAGGSEGGHRPLTTAFLANAGSALGRVLIGRDATTRAVALGAYGNVIDVAAGVDQQVYVVLHAPDGSSGAGSYWVLRLEPR